MDRVWLGLAGFYGLTGVMMAALAAHALPGKISATALGLVHTAIEMQMWHALALLACGILARFELGAGRRRISLAGIGFALGTLLFCGAVYGLALGGRELPALAPTGGFLVMAGWLGLGSLAIKRRPVQAQRAG